MSNQAKPDWELKQAAEQDLISFTDDTDTAAYKDALIRELFDALDVVPGQLDVTTRLIHEGYNEVLDLSPLLGTCFFSLLHFPFSIFTYFNVRKLEVLMVEDC